MSCPIFSSRLSVERTSPAQGASSRIDTGFDPAQPSERSSRRLGAFPFMETILAYNSRDETPRRDRRRFRTELRSGRGDRGSARARDRHIDVPDGERARGRGRVRGGSPPPPPRDPPPLRPHFPASPRPACTPFESSV